MIELTLARRRYLSRFLLGVLLLVGLAGCVTPEALIVKPPPTQEPINPHLQSALAHTPATVTLFAFTDWDFLKKTAGITQLTSADNLRERMTFMSTLAVEEQALGSAFANNYFPTHAEDWGWDSTDLLWEASITADGPPLYLLRFHDDFRFVPVFNHLAERQYVPEEYAGTPLYTHAMDLSADWLNTTELAILNIAFIEEENIFVLSSSPDTVKAALDGIAKGSTLLGLPAMRSVAAALGNVGAAAITPLGCLALESMPLVDARADVVRETLLEGMDRSGITGLYTVFGLGYRVEMLDGERVPLGVLVHHYPIAAQATADLEPRRQVAETATSLTSKLAYADLFEVVDAKTVADEGNSANLILSLHAKERPPQLFFDMFYRRDLIFSACGASQE